jgi:hypothetical protein
MKRRISRFLIVSLMLSMSVLSTWAQTDGKKGQFFFLVDAVVIPSMESQYFRAAENKVAFYAKNRFPFSWTVYSTEDYHYFWLLPIQNLKALDDLYAAFEEMKEKEAKECETMLNAFEGTFRYLKQSVYIWRPDLSYRTEDPIHQQREGDFVYMDFCYVYPGRDAEFERCVGELMSLMKSKDRTEMINTLVGDLGTDRPMYILTTNAKNAADFYVKNDRFWKALGGEGSDLYTKIISLIRKREIRHGRFRPDLSYNPR